MQGAATGFFGAVAMARALAQSNGSAPREGYERDQFQVIEFRQIVIEKIRFDD
jgi:hypothetical protein